MTQRTENRSRVQRDGTSQSKRSLPALSPGFVAVDARDVGDFLVFAQRFAKRVIYYKLDNTESGLWDKLFDGDASLFIAAIERTNPLPLEAEFKVAIKGTATTENLKQRVKLLVELAEKLIDWRNGVGDATDFREQIDRRMNANLKETVLMHWLSTNRQTDLKNHYQNSFREISDVTKQHLEDEFSKIYGVLVTIIRMAPGYLDQDLSKRSNVEPHIALFIAFLRLYLLLRDDANQLGQKHLDFFYERVLRIQRRSATADKVHVIVNLAKQIAHEHRLTATTQLDAGKDATGVPLIYALDEDLVAGQTQIKSFKTIFVDSEKRPDGSFPRVAHAAPVANSGDGKGAKIEDAERPSWPTLGSKETPQAVIGFALASRSLLLAQGARTITVELQGTGFSSHLPESLARGSLVVELSGGKGWFQPDESTAKFESGNDGIQSSKLTLTIKLKSTAEAVSFGDPKVLGENYGSLVPILKVTLDQSKVAYGLLEGVRLEKITLKTEASGITNVVVQNDLFAMSAAKPFLPFGPSPSVGSNFYIGCAEAFERKLTNLKINVTWDSLPTTFAAHYEGYDVGEGKPEIEEFKVRAEILQDGKWVVASDGKQLFEKTSEGNVNKYSTIEVQDLAFQEPRPIGELREWTPATQHGFLRLSLKDQSFYHSDYVRILTRQSLANARLPKCTPGAKYKGKDEKVVTCTDTNRKEIMAIVPNAPYTPTIKAMELAYEATVDSTSPEAITFFHLEPFGYRQLTLPTEENPQPQPLLAQFNDEGSLYIGLEKLEPQQSLSILFQVVEATADAEVKRPEVDWYYLQSNEWKPFNKFDIASDTTRGLIASGIVHFKIPKDINSRNTLLPSDLFWLRASVKEGATGVSDLINAHTQAARATLVLGNNDPIHLKSPLSADSVSKLVQEDMAVSGIVQPYDGFGGRPVENGMTYYTRVAEHLRHKGRPITLFDYERLVLENFPKIYKVKCVNHTNAQHQLAPGNLLVAVIPDFSQLKAVDRRQPKVTLDDLDAIRAYLESINCPFVHNDQSKQRERLHVMNPIYEFVKVTFKVKFQANVTATEFHKRQLNEDINRFLSPWAFENGVEISFGGKVYKSSILNFVEKRSYVDFVTDFEMSHKSREDLPASEDLDAIEAATPRSVLIPDQQHDITVIEEDNCRSSNASNSLGSQSR